MDGTLCRRRRWQAVAIGAFILLGLGGLSLSRLATWSGAIDSRPLADFAPLELGQPSGLPLPSTVSVPQFEEKLFAFLNARQYEKLGWKRDKCVRDTGPYIGGKYYGTHPAVRVYYSPGVMRWLVNGRAGKIPDGEMIIMNSTRPPRSVTWERRTRDCGIPWNPGR